MKFIILCNFCTVCVFFDQNTITMGQAWNSVVITWRSALTKIDQWQISSKTFYKNSKFTYLPSLASRRRSWVVCRSRMKTSLELSNDQSQVWSLSPLPPKKKFRLRFCEEEGEKLTRIFWVMRPRNLILSYGQFIPGFRDVWLAQSSYTGSYIWVLVLDIDVANLIR